jgi:hypothetical protein
MPAEDRFPAIWMPSCEQWDRNTLLRHRAGLCACARSLPLSADCCSMLLDIDSDFDRSEPNAVAGIFGSFIDYDLGYIDLEEKTLQPLDNSYASAEVGRGPCRNRTDSRRIYQICYSFPMTTGGRGFLFCTSIVLLASLPNALSATLPKLMAEHASKTQERRLHREISMGTASFRLDETCITIGSRLSSSDFFDGLLLRRTSSGVEFFRGLTRVEEFPPVLAVEATFLIVRCSDRQLQTEEAAENILRGLQFKFEWKRGLAVRPTAEFSYQFIKPATFQGGARKADTLVWTVQLIVRDIGIPLTDDLILSVFSKDDNKRLARFAARL